MIKIIQYKCEISAQETFLIIINVENIAVLLTCFCGNCEIYFSGSIDEVFFVFTWFCNNVHLFVKLKRVFVCIQRDRNRPVLPQTKVKVNRNALQCIT